MEEIKLTEMKNLGEEKWNELVYRSPQATYFHSYDFARRIEETKRQGNEHYISTKLISFRDGTEVFFPLYRHKIKGGQVRYTTNPLALGAECLILVGELSRRKGEQIFSWLRGIWAESLSIFHNIFPEYPAEVGGFKRKEYFTHVLQLERDFSTVWNTMFHSYARNRTRKAEKSGVEIIQSNSLADFHIYFEIYLDTIRRWGMSEPIYPYDVFKSLAGIPEENVKLYLAYYKGRAIAGIIVFNFTKELVYYWNGAMLKNFSIYCPNNLLHKVAIENACKLGFRYYNLGPSVDFQGNVLTNLIRFKERMGGKKVYRYYYEHQSRVTRLLNRLTQVATYGKILHWCSYPVRIWNEGISKPNIS